MADALDKILEAPPAPSAGAPTADPLDAIIANETRMARARGAEFVENPLLQQALGGATDIVGALAFPLVGIANRPKPGDPGYEEFVDRWNSQHTGQRILEDIGRSVQATRAAATYVGIRDPRLQAPQTYGEELAYALPGAALGGLAAPRFAGAVAASARPGSTLARAASAVAERPALALAESLTAAPGAVAAGREARPYLERAFPDAETSWAQWLAKGTATLAAEAVGGSLTSALSRPLTRRIPGINTFERAQVPPRGIVEEDDTLAAAARATSMQAAQHVDQMDNAMAAVFERVNATQMPEAQASRVLRDGLLSVREFSNRMVQRAYSRLPQGVTGNPTGLRDELLDMVAEAQRLPAEVSNYPVDIARRTLAQLREGFDAQGRPIWRQNVPVEELNRIRSQLIRNEVVTTEGVTRPQQRSRELNTNINRLVTAADNSIEGAAMTTNPAYLPALRLANNLYRVHNERFMRGPIGEWLSTKAGEPLARRGNEVPGVSNVAPTQLARQMVDPTDEGAAAIDQALNAMVANGTRPDLADLVAQGVRGRADQALRSIFERDVLRGLEARISRSAPLPEGLAGGAFQGNLARQPSANLVARAQDFMERNGPLIENWTGVTNDINSAIGRGQRLLRARDEYTRGMAYRMIDGDPSAVIQRGLTLNDPARAFRQLYQTASRNPDALEGFQRELVNQLFSGHGASPRVALQRMQSPGFQSALSEMFANRPEDLTRLYNLVRDVDDLAGNAVISSSAGNARFSPQLAAEQLSRTEAAKRWGQTQLTHIAGIITGGIISQTIPGTGAAGSLAIPALMSRTFRGILQHRLASNQTEAVELLRQAVFNPGLEASLRDVLPNNYIEARHFFNTLMARNRRAQIIFSPNLNELVNSQEGRDARMREDAAAKAAEQNLRKSPFEPKQ